MEKRILIGSIIAVIILVLVSFPTVISEKIKPENEALDNGYREIYTHVNGECVYLRYGGFGFFIFFSNISTNAIVDMDIEAHTLNPLEPVYHASPKNYFYAPFFIGFISYHATDRLYIVGTAFGNIEWS